MTKNYLLQYSWLLYSQSFIAKYYLNAIEWMLLCVENNATRRHISVVWFLSILEARCFEGDEINLVCGESFVIWRENEVINEKTNFRHKNVLNFTILISK